MLFDRIRLFIDLGNRINIITYGNLKILVPPGRTIEQTFDLAEKVILAHGYIKEGSIGEGESYLQYYTKDKFKIDYSPNDDAQKKLGVIYIAFYEYNDMFSSSGMAEYNSIKNDFLAQGFTLSTENEADREQAKWAWTPEMYNSSHSQDIFPGYVKAVLFSSSALLLYGILVFWPAFWIALRFQGYLTLSIWQKRIIFIGGSGFYYRLDLSCFHPSDLPSWLLYRLRYRLHFLQPLSFLICSRSHLDVQ